VKTHVDKNHNAISVTILSQMFISKMGYILTRRLLTNFLVFDGKLDYILKKNPNQIALNTFKVQYNEQLS